MPSTSLSSLASTAVAVAAKVCTEGALARLLAEDDAAAKMTEVISQYTHGCIPYERWGILAFSSIDL